MGRHRLAGRSRCQITRLGFTSLDRGNWNQSRRPEQAACSSGSSPRPRGACAGRVRHHADRFQCSSHPHLLAAVAFATVSACRIDDSARVHAADHASGQFQHHADVPIALFAKEPCAVDRVTLIDADDRSIPSNQIRRPRKCKPRECYFFTMSDHFLFHFSAPSLVFV